MKITKHELVEELAGEWMDDIEVYKSDIQKALESGLYRNHLKSEIQFMLQQTKRRKADKEKLLSTTPTIELVDRLIVRYGKAALREWFSDSKDFLSLIDKSKARKA